MSNTWEIVGAQSFEAGDDPHSSVLYHLTFNGETAGNMLVKHFQGAASVQVQFVPEHEGNDGAYIGCLALKALYDNQTAMRERTGVEDDFEFVEEAFKFAGSYLEFTY